MATFCVKCLYHPFILSTYFACDVLDFVSYLLYSHAYPPFSHLIQVCLRLRLHFPRAYSSTQAIQSLQQRSDMKKKTRKCSKMHIPKSTWLKD